MIVHRVATVLCSLLLAVACVSGTKPEYSELPDDGAESGLVSIAYLKSRCNGLSTTITSDLSIKGTVVANDLFGEFYKTLVLVDKSGGVEISIDRESLCDDFPLYANVSVICNGLAVGRVGGKVVLGAQPTGEYTTDRIADDDVSKYLHWYDNDISLVEPRRAKISELGVEHISDYILFEGVRFADDEVGKRWCEKVDDEWVDTERHIVDAEGNMMTIRVSSYCEYASEKLPSGSGALCGIVGYAGEEYYLRIANHEVYF